MPMATINTPTESSTGNARVVNTPKNVTGPLYKYREACKRLHRDPMPVSQDDFNRPETPNSRDMVRWFLSALGEHRPQANPPTLPKDLGALNRVMLSVVHAVDADVLTEEEADAVIHFVAECFTRRRMDEVLAGITKPRRGSWFLVHGHGPVRED